MRNQTKKLILSVLMALMLAVTFIACSGAKVESVAVSGDAVFVLGVGEQTKTLTATVLPDKAKAEEKVAVWSSDNDAVAAVDASTGEVTAVGVGTAKITAAVKSGVSASKTVVVQEPVAVKAIAIHGKIEKDILAVLGTEQLSVDFSPANANIGKDIEWSSIDTTVATVDAGGVVTYKKLGEKATIIANVEGSIIAAQFTTTPIQVAAIAQVMGGAVSVGEGIEPNPIMIKVSNAQNVGVLFEDFGASANGSVQLSNANVSLVANDDYGTDGTAVPGHFAMGAGKYYAVTYKGVSAGNTTVTVTIGGVSIVVQITVIAASTDAVNFINGVNFLPALITATTLTKDIYQGIKALRALYEAANATQKAIMANDGRVEVLEAAEAAIAPASGLVTVIEDAQGAIAAGGNVTSDIYKITIPKVVFNPATGAILDIEYEAPASGHTTGGGNPTYASLWITNAQTVINVFLGKTADVIAALTIPSTGAGAIGSGSASITIATGVTQTSRNFASSVKEAAAQFLAETSPGANALAAIGAIEAVNTATGGSLKANNLTLAVYQNIVKARTLYTALDSFQKALVAQNGRIIKLEVYEIALGALTTTILNARGAYAAASSVNNAAYEFTISTVIFNKTTGLLLGINGIVSDTGTEHTTNLNDYGTAWNNATTGYNRLINGLLGKTAADLSAANINGAIANDGTNQSIGTIGGASYTTVATGATLTSQNFISSVKAAARLYLSMLITQATTDAGTALDNVQSATSGTVDTDNLTSAVYQNLKLARTLYDGLDDLHKAVVALNTNFSQLAAWEAAAAALTVRKTATGDIGASANVTNDTYKITVTVVFNLTNRKILDITTSGTYTTGGGNPTYASKWEAGAESVINTFLNEIAANASTISINSETDDQGKIANGNITIVVSTGVTQTSRNFASSVKAAATGWLSDITNAESAALTDAQTKLGALPEADIESWLVPSQDTYAVRKTQVEATRAAYDKLNNYQKGDSDITSTINRLTNAEARITLCDPAFVVYELIDALPASITATSITATLYQNIINNIPKLYNFLVVADDGSAALVTNYSALATKTLAVQSVIDTVTGARGTYAAASRVNTSGYEFIIPSVVFGKTTGLLLGINGIVSDTGTEHTTNLNDYGTAWNNATTGYNRLINGLLGKTAADLSAANINGAIANNGSTNQSIGTIGGESYTTVATGVTLTSQNFISSVKTAAIWWLTLYA